MDNLLEQNGKEEENDEDIDDIDVKNYRGIFVEEEPQEKYQDEITGAHFEYHDICNRLTKLITETQIKKEESTKGIFDIERTLDSHQAFGNEGYLGTNRANCMKNLTNNEKINLKENQQHRKIEVQICDSSEINHNSGIILQKSLIINNKSNYMKKTNTRNENFLAKQLELGTSELISSHYNKLIKLNNYITSKEKEHQKLNKINDKEGYKIENPELQKKLPYSNPNKFQNQCYEKKINLKGIKKVELKPNKNKKEESRIKTNSNSNRNNNIYQSFKGNSRLSGLSLHFGNSEKFEIGSTLSPGTINGIKSSICLVQKLNNQSSYPKRYL